MNAVTDNARATQAAPRRGFRALGAALGAALQWRLLLLWLLATLVPALLAVLPLGDALQAQFGHSFHAGEIASGQRMGLLLQGLGNIGQHSSGVVFTSLLAASVPMLLLAPFLPAMIVASLRAGRRLGFAELVAGGCGQYWRMLRMLLWSIVPLGTALVFAGAVTGFATKSTEHAILAADVESAFRLALCAAALVFVVLHASVEAGRGWLGADAGLRSVLRAWWRGLKLLVRRPLATLGVYLGATVLSLLVALLFAWLRLRLDGPGTGAYLLGILLTQGIVLALAWGKIARLYGLADLAADAAARTQPTPAAPAGTAEPLPSPST
ncbi:hypothetical protein GCM10022229_13520 [Luteimonas lutimaris]|uniref:Uncharacterized protein n=1 Tax=Luteimonas lutimaris TaxID=698645 RepID=A0ABP7MEF7_9GAMM